MNIRDRRCAGPDLSDSEDKHQDIGEFDAKHALHVRANQCQIFRRDTQGPLSSEGKNRTHTPSEIAQAAGGVQQPNNQSNNTL